MPKPRKKRSQPKVSTAVEPNNGGDRKSASPKKPSQSWFTWHLVCAILLLALMATEMIWMARVKSATMDEPNHITRGVVYLRTGDLRLGRVHPPLINIICALPLAWDQSIVLPLEHSSWAEHNLDVFSDEFLWKANQNGPSIVFKARLPIIGLSLLLAIIVYAWARELFGAGAALMALALLAFDPNVLAHGSLATNDMGVACFSTLALYTFWRWLRYPRLLTAIIASVAFGLAQASKFSAVLLIPSFVLIALATWLLMPADERPRINVPKVLGWLGVIALASAVIVWAIYGFKIGAPGGENAGLPAYSYFHELRFTLDRVGKGSPTYLLGSYSDTGWWYYFPVALLVKTPLPTLLLAGWALVHAWRRRTMSKSLVLLIPAALILLSLMVSYFNIGYRHLLPALVLVLIFIAQLAQASFTGKSKQSWAVGILIGWLAVGSLYTFPDHLAFFNELAGGPSNGHKVLADSNLDWGQDLRGLRDYMQRENIKAVKLSYFGSADPAAYGIDYEALPSFPRYIWRSDSFPPFLFQPDPGVYAISATNLMGGVFKIHNMYGWFRERKPDAVIGHTIFVYKVSQ